MMIKTMTPSQALLTLLVTTLLRVRITDSQNIQQFGQTAVSYAANTNVLNAASLIGNTNGYVFLFSNSVSQTGVLFAFSVYVYNTQPYTFQIYRPTGPTNNQFQLIDELQITPSIRQGREDVYLDSFIRRNCTVVLPGDRLALYFQSSVPSIAYTYSNNPLSNYVNQLQMSQAPTIGQVYIPDQLSLNYIFFATAYYSTGSNLNSGASSVPCANAKIPGGIVTIPPPTTPYPTGAQGAHGVQGVNGVVGLLGPIGATGSTGSTGSTGAPGEIGFPGPNGPAGDTGATGVQGYTGPIGHTGSTGSMGYMGIQGDTGSVGSPGRMGDNMTWYLLTRPPQTTLSQSPNLGQDTMNPVPWWTTDAAIWGMFLWLAIISFILLIALIFLIFICYYCGQIQRQTAERSSSRKNLVK